MTPQASGAVIALRPRDRGFDVLLVRRSATSAFMPEATVFPGGKCESGENTEAAARRELAEETGLIAPTTLVRWAEWITPSVPGPRFAATFWIGVVASAASATADAHETIETHWLRPAEALVRAGELQLPPPQLRTIWELIPLVTVADVMNAAHRRAAAAAPILPRVLGPETGDVTLVAPWDPAYAEAHGDAVHWADRPWWATGRSRFVRRGRTWSHEAAPL